MIRLPDWRERKPHQPQFAKQLPNLRLMDGETTIAQSIAILNVVGSVGGLMGQDRDFAMSQMLVHEAEEWYNLLYKFSYKPYIMQEDAWSEESSQMLWDESENGGWGQLKGRIVGVVSLLAERKQKSKQTQTSVGVDRFTSTGVTIGEISLFALLHQAVAGPFPDAADLEPSEVPDLGSGAARCLRPFYNRMVALPEVQRTLSGETAAGELLVFFGKDPRKP